MATNAEFERARALYYFTAVHRVLASEVVYQAGVLNFTRKIPIVGIPYSFPEAGRVGPQCATVPIKLIRGNDLKPVLQLSDRFALESKSSFARVYRDKGIVRIEFTLPPEQWTRVRARELPHRKEHPAFGKLSLGNVAYMSFDTSPHKLLSGGTQKGKTTTLVAIIYSLMRANDPKNLRLLILNPKGEKKLDLFGRSPYLFAPIGHSYDECVNLFRIALAEMSLRKGDRGRCEVRLVVIADEIADLVQQRPEIGKMIKGAG